MADLRPVGRDDPDVLRLDTQRNVFPDQLLDDERLVVVRERLVGVFAALRRLEEVAAGGVDEHEVNPGFGAGSDTSEIRQPDTEKNSSFAKTKLGYVL